MSIRLEGEAPTLGAEIGNYSSTNKARRLWLEDNPPVPGAPA